MSNRHLFLTSGFIKVPLQNGVGRYVCQLQRVVLKFCKSSGASRGMREFIESDLVNFAKNHPETVVYVKPRRHRGPVIKAEYLDGTTQWVNCRQFSRDEILKWLEHLKKQQTNHTGTRIRKLWHTENPSIQGPWTPFTFRDPKLNLAEFPNEELSKPLQKSENTYEELVELFKRQKLQKMNEEKNDPEKISASN